jgi:hypothetical protein
MLWLKIKDASVRVSNPLFVKQEEKNFQTYGNINKRFTVIRSKFIQKELKQR